MKQTLICVLAFAAAPVLAQTPRFSTGTTAVRVDVLVTDGGRPVRGLTASDFDLRDNGIQQRIVDVSHEKLPLNVISVLDLSSSVDGAPLVQLKDAMTTLIGALDEGDRGALVMFSHRLELYARLTGDRQKLRDLVSAAKAIGSTSLIDATFAGLALREADPGRTLMLLFSDGRDTLSWLSASDVLEAARRTDVVVYPVRVREASMPGPTIGNDEGERLLDAFADETGGRVFVAGNERTLQKTFTDVLTEFRQRYVLSYSPSGVAGEGWHTIEVKLRGRRGQVKARPGYVAAPVRPAGAARAPR